MHTDFERVRQLFLTIVEQPSGRWEALLDEAGGTDAELRQQVALLLEAHAEGEGILDRNASCGGPTRDCESLNECPGTVIGPYKLLQQIGEGGMGTVFMAEQTEPVQRKVALKLIKAGMDSRQVIARFEAERQALALMDHPNIARVLDAGTTSGSTGGVGPGRPYFVMELVKGVPITKYCDERHLTPKARLELFMPVCQAVQHAHQKGLIHRDLKPSNVLVAEYDDQPVAKVIDFGVAKATAARLTERTLFTELGQVVGTLEYMSPEQAKLNALDIDTRSDIYALGVLLYELLTGTTPFQKKRLREAAFDEMLRIIREEEPPTPSTRLRTTVELPSIAANRSLEPKKLSGLVRGELDWIVMKCLEKDRNRRYETANGLAADIQRHLHDEPVQACPPTAGYRLRKFARRNKGPVAAGLALAGLLVLATVGTSIGLRWALQERDEAVSAKTQAEAERARANEEASISEAINEFLRKDLLAEAAPEQNARDKKVTVEEVLGRAATHIAGKFEGRPRVEAAIRLTIGVTYHKLGNFLAAQPHLERALELRRGVLGERHPDTLIIMNRLAAVYSDQGQFAKAEAVYLKALELCGQDTEEEYEGWHAFMTNLAGVYCVQGQYAKAEPLLIKALELNRRNLGPEHSCTRAAMSHLATVYRSQGEFAKAEPLYVEDLEITRGAFGKEHPDTLICVNNLAMLYITQGRYGKAESLLVETLDISRRVSGEEHPDTLTWASNLAWLYHDKGQYAKAEPLFVKTLDISRRVLGEEHPDTLECTDGLGVLYTAQGRYAKAEPLLIKDLEIRRRVMGEDNPRTIGTMNALGQLYRAQRQYAKAEPLLAKALEVDRRVLGEEHPSTADCMKALGVLYTAQGQYAKAEPLLVKALEVNRRIMGKDHLETLRTMKELAALYRSMAKLDRSIPLFEETLAELKAKLGVNHPNTFNTAFDLGYTYHDAGRLDEAIAVFDEWLPRAKAVLEPGQQELEFGLSAGGLTYNSAGQHKKGELLNREALQIIRQRGKATPQEAWALARLGRSLLGQKRDMDAELVLRESLEICTAKLPDDWNTFSTKSLLGGSLLGQKKFAEAEPLLLAGYEGMKQREEKIPWQSKCRLTESEERLVQLYEATGEKDKAARWRKRPEQPKDLPRP